MSLFVLFLRLEFPGFDGGSRRRRTVCRPRTRFPSEGSCVATPTSRSQKQEEVQIFWVRVLDLAPGSICGTWSWRAAPVPPVVLIRVFLSPEYLSDLNLSSRLGFGSDPDGGTEDQLIWRSHFRTLWSHLEEWEWMSHRDWALRETGTLSDGIATANEARRHKKRRAERRRLRFTR